MENVRFEFDVEDRIMYVVGTNGHLMTVLTLRNQEPTDPFCIKFPSSVKRELRTLRLDFTYRV